MDKPIRIRVASVGFSDGQNRPKHNLNVALDFLNIALPSFTGVGLIALDLLFCNSSKFVNATRTYTMHY